MKPGPIRNLKNARVVRKRVAYTDYVDEVTSPVDSVYIQQIMILFN
jgi:hypothetical protein